MAPFGRPPSGQTAITVANMYRFKKCYILARTSLLLLPFRYAATVLYNSNNRMQWGGGTFIVVIGGRVPSTCSAFF